MTAVKLASTILAGVQTALEPYADEMFHSLGRTYQAIIELRPTTREESADDEEKDPAVKLRITRIEIARDPADCDTILDLGKHLYQKRTTPGTLDEHLADTQRVPKPRRRRNPTTPANNDI